jgi:hypothetical protein
VWRGWARGAQRARLVEAAAAKHGNGSLGGGGGGGGGGGVAAVVLCASCDANGCCMPGCWGPTRHPGGVRRRAAACALCSAPHQTRVLLRNCSRLLAASPTTHIGCKPKPTSTHTFLWYLRRASQAAGLARATAGLLPLLRLVARLLLLLLPCLLLLCCCCKCYVNEEDDASQAPAPAVSGRLCHVCARNASPPRDAGPSDRQRGDVGRMLRLASAANHYMLMLRSACEGAQDGARRCGFQTGSSESGMSGWERR